MNLAAIANIVNNLYLLIWTLGGLISIWFVYRGITRFIWASQLGGMNSMGTRNFVSEGLLMVLGGVIAGYFTWFVTATTGDLYGAQPYQWKQLQDTGNSLRFIGDFIVSSFTIMGFVMAYQIPGMTRKVSSGEATGSSVVWQLIIAIMCTQVEWLSQQISTFTPFNPFGLFFGQPIISM